MKEKEWYQDRMYEMRRELAQEQERLADKDRRKSSKDRREITEVCRRLGRLF